MVGEHDLRGHREGTPRFAVYEGTTTAEVFIDFCQRLLHDTDARCTWLSTGILRIGPRPPSDSWPLPTGV